MNLYRWKVVARDPIDNSVVEVWSKHVFKSMAVDMADNMNARARANGRLFHYVVEKRS